MFQTFSWNGKPIKNIHRWAVERGEWMVHYRATRKTIDIATGTIGVEERLGHMPESFWNALLTSSDGWMYSEITRTKY